MHMMVKHMIAASMAGSGGGGGSSGGSGGVSSWNDLTDKPFYEETNGVVIEWDGNADGKTVYDVVGDGTVLLVHVSDTVLTADDLSGATMSGMVVSDNTVFECSEYQIESVEKVTLLGGFNPDSSAVCCAYVVSEPGETGGINFASAGVYFAIQNGITVKRLACGATTIHHLDEKFIPDTIARVDDIPEIPEIPVQSVNGKTGHVTIEIPEPFSGSWNDMTDIPLTTEEAHVKTLEYDGNKREDHIEVRANTFYKILDLPSEDTTIEKIVLSDGTVVDFSSGEGTLITDYNATMYVCDPYGQAVVELGSTYDVYLGVSASDKVTVHREPGIYVNAWSSNAPYPTSVVYRYTVEPFIEDMIPDSIARVEDVSAMINEALGVIENGTY